MSATRSLLAALAGAASALVVMHLLGGRGGASDDRPSPQPSHAAVPTSRYVRDSIDERSFREMVRAAIRDELRNSAVLQPPLETEPEKEVEERSADHARSVEVATRVIDDAITQGRWTAADLERIRPHMASLDEDTHRHLMSRFMVAVNAQELRVDAFIP